MSLRSKLKIPEPPSAIVRHLARGRARPTVATTTRHDKRISCNGIRKLFLIVGSGILVELSVCDTVIRLRSASLIVDSS